MLQGQPSDEAADGEVQSYPMKEEIAVMPCLL